MCDKETRITSLSEYEKIIEENCENFLYRGQANADWRLETSLSREFKKPIMAKVANKYEIEQEYIDRFKREYSYRFKKANQCETTIQALSIMQHFGVPTRLLDVTECPLAALYFACKNSKELNKDGVVYCFPTSNQVDELKKICELIANTAKYIKNGNFSFDYIFNSLSRENLFNSTGINKKNLDQILRREILLHVEPNCERQKRQRGEFILLPNKYVNNIFIDEINEINLYSVRNINLITNKIIIDYNYKKKILKELKKKGITRKNLFHEKNKKIKKIANKIKRSVRRKKHLCRRNFLFKDRNHS